MKSRKVKATAKSKAFMSKKKLKGNIPLESDSEADVDSDDLLYDEKRDGQDNDLSTDDDLIRHNEASSEEEEVLPITDDEVEDEDDGNGESDYDEEEGLPNKEGWGRRKSSYYSADFVDEDRGRSYREEDAEKARMEAEEALAIQRSVSSVAANATTDILQFTLVDETSKAESENELNLEELEPKQKIRYLKKKCPELLMYIDEFKEKMSELKEKIVPLLDLVNKNKIQSEDCANFIKIKFQLLLNYCMNISFYMVLTSNGPVTSHPIVKRINSYKSLIDRMDNVNENFKKEVDVILDKLEQNEEVLFENSNDETEQSVLPENRTEQNLEVISKVGSVKEKKSKEKLTEAEKEVFSLYMDLQKQKKENEVASESEDSNMEVDIPAAPVDVEAGEKRTITYEIAKNKGLTAKRKKEHRNPRVHHRMKFRKAKIRRKGQVQQVIREVKRYQGEPTGISSHVIKSIKLK